MRWYLKLLALCCGASVPNGMLGLAPGHAASLPKSSPPVSAMPEAMLDQTAQPAPTPVTQPETSHPLLSQRYNPELQAQTPPTPRNTDQEQFLQPTPLPLPVTPEEQVPTVPSPPAPTAPPPANDSSIRIPVERIEIEGSTIFDETDFAAITQPYVGQSLTLEELRGIADRITQLYLDGGYITSRAVLVDQVVTGGVIQIRVIEGSLEQIEIEGNRRVNDAYIRSRVQMGGRTPLNQGRLEDQLRLLRLDPLFDNVEASLRAGSGLGQSILTVRVTEADRLAASLNVDNYSPPSVGSERTGAAATLLNVTGLGDELSASYSRSTTGGANLFDFSYRVPVNAMNGTLQLRAAPSNYRITDPAFSSLDIQGTSDLYELSFRQPLVRSPRQEFALSLGFTYRDGETLISDILADASTTSVFKFGQDYVRRDVQGAWAVRSQFSLGTELLDATTNSGSQPDGQFLSWLGQVQRVQILNPNHLLIMQADLQLTPDPLLPSQQFVVGGGQSLRGYRQNVRSGDNGFRLSVENRIALQRDESGAPTFQLAPFAEAGAVWNAGNNPNDLPNQTFLAGLGVGLLWEPVPDLNVRLDFALPLVDLDDRGTNAQDDGFYFSVNFQP